MLEHFKKHGLNTSIGDFIFEGIIGEGGNAKVFAFRKGASPFAIKVIANDKSGPLKRFKDEFFCAVQIPSHPNVARAYHFDTVTIDGQSYSLIVMRRYQNSLQGQGDIAGESDEVKAALGWKLLREIANGSSHLHKNGIVHRDIKPQNIFCDLVDDAYVIGDLGIAHFCDDLFARESKTRKGDRMANFAFSAPEQIDSKVAPAPTMDIFAIGQVLNWYLRGATIRGGGRQAYNGAVQNLSILDKIIDRCTRNDPKHRFQTIEELFLFESGERHPIRGVFEKLHDLDNAFRSSIPRIRDLFETSDPIFIDRFLTNFSSTCDPKEFWYIRSDGGDCPLNKLSKLKCGRWLLHNHYELLAKKLICYRHRSEWQSFFILLISPDAPFDVVDADGNILDRSVTEKEDHAVWYQDRYIDMADAENGYYQHSNQMIQIDSKKTNYRARFLQEDAILIVPIGSGSACISDSTHSMRFIRKIIKNQMADIVDVNAYLHATIPYTDAEITNRL